MNLITAIRTMLGKDKSAPPKPYYPMNRKARRAIAFASTAERRMRLERAAIRVAKRKAKKRPSDNGAKYLRAYRRGVQNGTEQLVLRVRQAYQIGLTEGKKARLPVPVRFLVRA